MATLFHQRTMHVYMLGLGEQLQNSLNFLFDSAYPGEYVIVEHSADFSIVDIDNYDGKQQLRKHHTENPGQVLILLSVKEMQVQSDSNIVYLRKPFSKKQMVAAIDQARSKASKQYVAEPSPNHRGNLSQEVNRNDQDLELGNHDGDYSQTAALTASKEQRVGPDMRANEHKRAILSSPLTANYRPHGDNSQYSTLALSRQDMLRIMGDSMQQETDTSALNLEYNPGRFLSGVLLSAYARAAKSRRRLLIKVRDFTILLEPKRALAWLDMDSIRETSLVSMPLEKSWLGYKFLDSGETIENIQGKPISMEALIWETALYGARGRVPKGTMLDRPVRLKHWPNFTRILLFPEAMRIAALLSEHTYSLTKTAQLLKIDERSVYSFYSAAYALGLVSIAHIKTTQTEELAEEPLPHTRKRALFNGILERLKTSIFSEKS